MKRLILGLLLFVLFLGCLDTAKKEDEIFTFDEFEVSQNCDF